MLASVDHKFDLLLQQKTGTTSLEQSLKPYSQFQIGGPPKWKHLDYFTYKSIFGDYFERNGCEVLGVVRDPISHMKSIYRYRTRAGVNKRRSVKGKTFSEFVDAWQRDDVPAFARYQTPSHFFGTANGAAANISYVRYENLSGLCAMLSTHVGEKIVLPVLNASPAMRFDYDWDSLRNSPKMQAEYAFYEALSFRYEQAANALG